MTSAKTEDAMGPLILGAGGQIGTAFRTLWERGAWPDRRRPLWHRRQGNDFSWDMLAGPAPRDRRLSLARGVIVLAGGVSGGTDPSQNASLACAAIDLAKREGLGPVLLCSSQAVYGRAKGPQGEGNTPHPVSAYGQAKLEMEAAVAGEDGLCCLRIGNVAGSDTLLRNAALGPVKLDQFPDGKAPRRCYIGPKSLAASMLALIEAHLAGQTLPSILNISAPGEQEMADLLTEAGAKWSWVPAPDAALPSLSLDLTLMNSIAPLPEAAGSAQSLLAEARAAGWGLAA